jgi:predicted cupin superfamily sugar epimerase
MNGLSFGRTVIVLVGIYFLLNKDIPPGKWWRIAKSISNFTKARDPPPFLEHDGQIFIHPSDKAE